MKEYKKIPTKKIHRAAKLIGTGIKVSGNYAKHYSKNIFKKTDRKQLDKDNAEDIYEALSELKGGALKIAQMMSMNDALPQAYTEQFSMAQYSATPLSYQLIVKTFRKEFGKSPKEIFDKFKKNAENAASIGQVHIAQLKGKKLAVKIQYPGVADSLEADIKMVKPLAVKLLKMNKEELNYFASEVENMLKLETDYRGELQRSIEISEACQHIENLRFPKYYPKFSSKKIITMEWIEGTLLDKFTKASQPQEVRNKIGQAIWDFYSFQMHKMKKFHADPHAGNFIITPENKLCVIDFGAVKEIPHYLYEPYFKIVLLNPKKDREEINQIYKNMNMIIEKDTPQERELFIKMFDDLVEIVRKPFKTGYFDFGNSKILEAMFELGEKYKHNKTLKNANAARGVKDAIYLNRTYFGMYSILSRLGAKINTHHEIMNKNFGIL